jgi:hypothetical protein
MGLLSRKIFSTNVQPSIIEYSCLKALPYVDAIAGNHECGFPFDKVPPDHSFHYYITAELRQIS